MPSDARNGQARVCRLEGLAVDVLTALGGHDGAVGDGGVNEVLTGRGLGQRRAGLAAVCRPIRSNAKRGCPGPCPKTSRVLQLYSVLRVS